GITPNRATLRPDVSRSGLMEDRRGFAAGPLSEYWTPNWTPAATSQSPRIAKEPENSGSLLIGETGFEPATARPPAGCATRLRHSPWQASGRRELNPFLELGRLPCNQNTSPARATQCYRRLR